MTPGGVRSCLLTCWVNGLCAGPQTFTTAIQFEAIEIEAREIEAREIEAREIGV